MAAKKRATKKKAAGKKKGSAKKRAAASAVKKPPTKSEILTSIAGHVQCPRPVQDQGSQKAGDKSSQRHQPIHR